MSGEKHLFPTVIYPTLISYFKLGILTAATRFYTFSSNVLIILLLTFKKPIKDNYQFTIEKVHRQLSLETERLDFTSPVLANGEEKGMTISEIEGTFNVIIIIIIMAGSDTTGTLPTYSIIWLHQLVSQHPIWKLVLPQRGRMRPRL